MPLPDASYDVALCQMGLMLMPDKHAALAELHRVLVPDGRVVINTPGRIQPPLAAVEQAIVDNLGPELGAFVSVVFSMHDAGELANLLRGAGFDDVSATEYTARLTLPGPAEFLWKYSNLTPMGPLVGRAPATTQDALERQVAETWAPYVVDGCTPVDQPMALASARRF